MPDCGGKTRVGLTKAEARAYTGFECERCKGWNQDSLSERDVPEWWEELAVTDLYALQEHPPDAPYEPSETVRRMNEEQKRRDEG